MTATMADSLSSTPLLLGAVSSSARARPPLILIVDDEPLNRFLVAEALAADQYQIVEADSGEAALAYMSEHQVDLILLDLDMPGMGGLAACRAIRALPDGELVPIAMVTGLDDSASIEQAFDSGATDFLTKPVNWTLMRQRVRFMLRLGSVTHDLQRNERALEQAQEIAQMGHWQWDASTQVVSHSAAFCRLMPGLPDQIAGTEPAGAPNPFGTRTAAAINRAIANGESHFRFECELDLPTRGNRRLLYHGNIEYSDGSPANILCTVQDVTERHRDEERYAAIFEASSVGIIETDCSVFLDIVQRPDFSGYGDDRLLVELGKLLAGDQRATFFVRANSVATRILGPDSTSSELRPLRLNLALQFLRGVREGRRELTSRCDLPLGEGYRHLIVSFRLPRSIEEYKRTVITINDITDLVDREMQLRRADAIIANSSDAIAILDQQQRIVAINPAFTKMIGYTLDELAAIGQLAYLADLDGAQTRAAIRHAIATQDYWHGEVEIRRRDGSLMPALLRINVIRNERGEVDGLFSITSDISHIKEGERRLFQLAHFDELTGLPNRLSLQERLHAEFERAQETPSAAREFALLYIDLDGFKLVNDSMGHSTGDKLLSKVSTRLAQCHLDGDLLTRIGGDEFALLMFTDISNAAIAAQAHRILDALETPFSIAEREIFIGASIGACRYPHEACTADEMLRNADSAMYEAKRLGRNQLCFYSSALTDESNRRLQIENELRVAIDSNQLFLAYQPKYDAASGAMIGAEALVRWNNPRRGIMPPGEFIGIAETSGLIIGLGEWVIKEACRQIAEWQRDCGCALPVAINISALHLRQHNLPQMLSDALTRFNVSPYLVELEITEDSLDFRGEEHAPYDILNQLSALGVSIAIDDFGTGYSSLSRLKEMPISTLKIDRSFVRDIASSESDHAIITAIVGLAKTLDMAIVAEGVETSEQAEQLRALKCNVLQGFLYSKPVTPSEVLDIFLAQRKHT